MNCIFSSSPESQRIAFDGLRELVRGEECGFVERLAPLVRRQSVTLDLSPIERIDAAGIAALISLYSIARDTGHQFNVVNASHHVAEILALVGLDHILFAHCSLPAAPEACLAEPAA